MSFRSSGHISSWIKTDIIDLDNTETSQQKPIAAYFQGLPIELQVIGTGNQDGRILILTEGYYNKIFYVARGAIKNIMKCHSFDHTKMMKSHNQGTYPVCN